MIFESEDCYVSYIEMTDIESVVDLYNSNTKFLEKHMNVSMVTSTWVMEELVSMKHTGFCSCKVIEKASEKIIGIMDYRVGEETYLSLLMIHKKYKNQGFGKRIYLAFEEHVKSQSSESIRLDVVTGYSDNVIKFWTRNGFSKVEDIELNWTGVILPAVTMKKKIN